MFFSYYKEHTQKRVNKIINIFGKDWFKNKTILELGACHGDIGIEFIKLGANVLFTDVREENLNVIKNKIPNPNLYLLNQNKYYDLKTKFDLVLHLGTLWHLENWYNDLLCATNHSANLILETKVLPKVGSIGLYETIPLTEKYNAYEGKDAFITQAVIENRLNELGKSFVRYDDTDLNVDFMHMNNNVYVKHVYDWNSEIYTHDPNKVIYHGRMWLVKSKGQ